MVLRAHDVSYTGRGAASNLKGTCGKAGGPTRTTNEMFKHLGDKGLELFAVL